MLTRTSRLLVFRNRRSLHAFPFRVTPPKAQEILESSRNWLQRNVKEATIEQAYIPFYKTVGVNANAKYVGEYGKYRTEIMYIPIYNNQTKMNQITAVPQTKTDWFACSGKHSIYVSPEQIKTNIYADFKYNPKIIESLTCPEFSNLQDLDIDVNTDSASMSENYAIDKIVKQTKKMLDSSTDNKIREHHKADTVRVTHMDYHIDPIKLTTYYVPVYICKFVVGKYEYYKIINGYNGKISGVHPYELWTIFGISSVLGCLGTTWIAIMDPVLIVNALICQAVFVASCVGLGHRLNVNYGLLCHRGGDKRSKRNSLYEPTEPKIITENPKMELPKEQKLLPLDKLQILGITDNVNVTKEILTEAKDKQLKLWNRNDRIGNVNISMINKTYEQLVSLLNK